MTGDIRRSRTNELPSEPLRQVRRVIDRLVRDGKAVAHPLLILYATMVTGVPSGAWAAICSMTSLGTRTQPLEMFWPTWLGMFVPCTASWPGPPLKDVSTSE